MGRAAARMKIVNVNNSCIAYQENFSFTIKDYYDYIVFMIYKVLESNPSIRLNVVIHLYFTPAQYRFPNNNKTIFMFINCEHTLVKRGGRDTQNAVGGVIPVIGSAGDDKYLVRIDNFALLNYGQVVIEYSNPNIENIRSCGIFTEFARKLMYVAPLLYSLHTSKENRTINCLTTFINTSQPRRKALLEEIKRRNIDHTNVSNCFSRDEIIKLYKNTRIMCNIHQTDDHHTFEELRVLPALSCGVIVVCETSPLNELIPYHNYVIWADYDKILDTVEEVQRNYNQYYDKIFGDENKIQKLYKKIEKENITNIEHKLRDF